ncbi:MAG: carboxypeptidase regulatory-like domain-containing protein [Pirellulales bacterium]|nr:carboxypeptidase regulatory-like domain-containing protein [Pirellulales bacterium]
MTRRMTRGGVVVLLASACWALALSPAAGLAEAPAGPVAGVVLDPADQPVAGATVLLVGRNNGGDPPGTLAETTTDSQGRFLFADVQLKGGVWPPAVLARDGQGRIGGGPWLWPRPDQPPLTDIKIKLNDVRECRGRLVDASGKPIVKATVAPKYWHCLPPRPAPGGSGASIEFPPAWAKELECETGPDGDFALRGIPERGRFLASIHAPGFGPLSAFWDLEKPVALKVPDAGRVVARVTGPTEQAVLTGIKLNLSSAPTDAGDRRDEPSVSYSNLAPTGADGTCAFEGVPAGKCRLQLLASDELPYYVDAPSEFDLKPGETARVSVPLKPAIVLRGKIVSKKTKAGVPGVSVALSINEGHTQLLSRKATTDANGQYEVHARPGKAIVELRDVPPEFLSTSRVSQGYTSRFLETDVAQDGELPPIELEPAGTVKGIVVDASGNPVAGAEIRYTDYDTFRTLQDVRRSDAEGRFSLGGLGEGVVSVRARTDKAAADPVNVKPSEAKEPIRLVVSEKTAMAVRGTIVDDAGAPLGGAQVALHTHWRTGRGGVGFQLLTATSDADGKFQVGGLWPGDEYNVQVTAEGHSAGASPQVQGARGLAHDFGPLVLRKTDGVVEGTVVDSADKPLAGVRVFNGGDAAEPIETTSDASGRFVLKGLFAGPVFVFADKPGYRFTRLRTPSGTTDAVLAMRGRDEPVEQPSAQAAAARQEEERKLAHALLERMWAVGREGRDWRTVALMARIDPEQARKWSAEVGGRHDRVIRRVVAEYSADVDADEAITALTEDPRLSFHYLKQTAIRFAASHPEKALRLAEEAVLRARGMDQAAKMSCLADVAPLLARLGQADAARAIAGEAAELAEKMRDSDANNYARGKVAAALAPYDFARALDLANTIGDSGERDRARSKVAGAASVDDLDRALAALEGVEPFFADRARLRLACRLAPTRPADAARIVDSLSSSSAFGFPKETKAQMLRWMAAATAPRDKAEAWKMVDAAFEIYLDPSQSEGREDYSVNRRATQAAALAVVAGQIGYPDMESVVSRTLAARVTVKQASSPASAVDSTAAMAMLLALVDPEAAAQVLASLEPQGDLVGSGFSGVRREVWLQAWAVADPRRAMELAEGELAKLKERRDVDETRRGLFEIVELWTLPADERFRRLAGHLHNLSFPDEE